MSTSSTSSLISNYKSPELLGSKVNSRSRIGNIQDVESGTRSCQRCMWKRQNTDENFKCPQLVKKGWATKTRTASWTMSNICTYTKITYIHTHKSSISLEVARILTQYSEDWFLKGGKLSIHPAIAKWTGSQSNQITDEEKLLFTEESQLINARRGTEGKHHHFATPKWDKDLGHGHQWPKPSGNRWGTWQWRARLTSRIHQPISVTQSGTSWHGATGSLGFNSRGLPLRANSQILAISCISTEHASHSMNILCIYQLTGNISEQRNILKSIIKV